MYELFFLVYSQIPTGGDLNQVLMNKLTIALAIIFMVLYLQHAPKKQFID